MFAPSFAETPQQRLVARIDKNQFDPASFAAQGVEHCGKRRQRIKLISRIDADRDFVEMHLMLPGNEMREVGQNANRQVVHAVKAGIFQRMQCYRFAGARQTGDDQEAPRVTQAASRLCRQMK